MARIVTCRNDAGGCFCQLQLNSGERILISIAQTGIQVRRLALGGIIPREVIANWRVEQIPNAMHLFADPRQPNKHPLDAIRDRLISLDSISAVRLFCSTGKTSPSQSPPVGAAPSRIDPRRVIAELEPLIHRYGDFLEANGHLIYGIPASRLETTLETTPEELKAALLRYGSAIRDCNLLDEQTRQMLRGAYCELARVLPEVEGNEAVAAVEAIESRSQIAKQSGDLSSLLEFGPLIDKGSTHLDTIAAETIRLMQEFDSQLPPACL